MVNKKKVILVVGSCCLDRLLTVSTYPAEDSKVRTDAYYEYGGGNAANTATAMARLLTKENAVCKHNDFVVKLLTKLGGDHVGKQLASELEKNGVDLSSPLFQSAGPNTTTSFTTIIVSKAESTRTCMHTYGSCGELQLSDVENVDLDEVFENVVHVHSDCRHLGASLALAKEARRRNITVSVDAEKDRHDENQHEMMELATTLFTNSQQLKGYFKTRTALLEKQKNRPLMISKKNANTTFVGDSWNVKSLKELECSSEPLAFYLRWCDEKQMDKDVIITKGHLGALRVHAIKQKSAAQNANCSKLIYPHDRSPKDFLIDHTINDGEFTKIITFNIQTTGTLKNVDVCDTTGAGDAFIGGYLMHLLVRDSSPQDALNFGAWVSGKKLEGPGAQSALPFGTNVEKELGSSVDEINLKLKDLLKNFG